MNMHMRRREYANALMWVCKCGDREMHIRRWGYAYAPIEMHMRGLGHAYAGSAALHVPADAAHLEVHV